MSAIPQTTPGVKFEFHPSEPSIQDQMLLSDAMIRATGDANLGRARAMHWLRTHKAQLERMSKELSLLAEGRLGLRAIPSNLPEIAWKLEIIEYPPPLPQAQQPQQPA